jgi:cytidine deaminase
MTAEILMEKAIEARTYSYHPYSGYAVGAALLCRDGSIYTGCNIENEAFGPTICAERTAMFKAISEGNREFQMLAIAGGKAEEEPGACYPCGVCRQVMAEFAGEDFQVICRNEAGDLETFSMSELLPKTFRKVLDI